jgi:hypothetical protein
MDKQKALRRFETALQRFLLSSRVDEFREKLRLSYEVMTNRQWDANDSARRQEDEKPVSVINMTAPLIRHITGNEIMQRNRLDFIPRGEDLDPSMDVMGDAADYVQDVSGFKTQQTIASEDALTCGLGGTTTYFDYSDKDIPWGKPKIERIFPGFLIYDTTVRSRNLASRSRYVGYIEPVASEWLDEYIEEKLGKEGAGANGAFGGDFGGRIDFLDYFGNSEFDDVDILYHLEWYENEDIYDVANPLREEMLKRVVQQSDEYATILGDQVEDLGLDVRAGLFSLTKEEFSKVKDLIAFVYESLGEDVPKLDHNKRKGRKYYRAEFARGACLVCVPNWSQTGFSTNVKTGYYDEVRGYFYGLIQHLLPVQRALNQTFSDLLEYYENMPKGGMYAELDALPDKEMFEASRAQSKRTTLLNNGAISGGKMMPKESPTVPVGLVEFFRLLMEVLPRTVGLDQQFFGIMQSGDMTNALYGRMMKQAHAVLAHFFDSDREYLQRQGRLFVEAVKMWAENNDGMQLQRLSPGKDQAAYFRLYEDEIADEYDVKIVERPITEEQKQEDFNKLTELYRGANPQTQQLLFPILIAKAPIEAEDKDKVLAALQPQPPQPNPVDEAMTKATVKLTEMQAMEAKARARKMLAEALTLEAAQPLSDERELAEVEEINSRTVANYFKAGQAFRPSPIAVEMP